MLNDTFRARLFGDKSVEDILKEDAQFIQARGADTREYTFEETTVQGFTRARIVAVPKKVDNQA